MSAIYPLELMKDILEASLDEISPSMLGNNHEADIVSTALKDLSSQNLIKIYDLKMGDCLMADDIRWGRVMVNHDLVIEQTEATLQFLKKNIWSQ